MRRIKNILWPLLIITVCITFIWCQKTFLVMAGDQHSTHSDEEEVEGFDPLYCLLSYWRTLFGISSPEDIQAKKARQQFEDLKKEADGWQKGSEDLEKRLEELEKDLKRAKEMQIRNNHFQED